MTTLIIARHGNTFNPDDTPTRVGARTDLPLVEKGREQARALGRYIKEHNLIPDVVYSSKLRRTIQTAEIAIKETGVSNPIFQLDIFNEIDYGPDENKPEEEVIARIGADAIKAWDEHAIVPVGWQACPQDIIQSWYDFAAQIIKPCHPERREGSNLLKIDPSLATLVQDDKTEDIVLVVTSNGIARFAPYITGDFDAFRRSYPLKLSTGALGILKHTSLGWSVKNWNIRP